MAWCYCVSNCGMVLIMVSDFDTLSCCHVTLDYGAMLYGVMLWIIIFGVLLCYGSV